MKTQKKVLQTEKQVYVTPEISSVSIDNQITMVMMTDPPSLESLKLGNLQKENPFKITRG